MESPLTGAIDMTKRAKLLIAATTATLMASPAAAYNQWGNYHWATDGTGLTLRIERQINASLWGTYFTSSVGDWDSSGKLSLTGGTSNLGVDPKKCSPISGKALVCNEVYGFRGWLGIATIWANGDHITQATTKLNDSYFNTASYNKPEWRQLVACQEIGHDFGLDHQDETFDNPNLGTCMDYTNAPLGGGSYGPLQNLHPNSDDYATLDFMYAHDDTAGGGGGGGGGTCNPRSPKCAGGQDAFTFREVGKSATGGGVGISVADTGEWGQAIARDGAGRPDTFLLDLGNGHRKITHVFWVPCYRPVPANMHD